MTTANLTRDETAARSAAITVRAYRVELDLAAAPDQSRPGFATTTTLEFDATAAQTWIDFLGLSVESVTVNGETVPVEYDGARIAVRGLGPSNVVTVAATGEYSRSGEGLHRFVDPEDGADLPLHPVRAGRRAPGIRLLRAAGPEGAVHLRGDRPGGLGGGLANRRAAHPRGRRCPAVVEFEPTLPISTYLTAVVAGPVPLRDESSWTPQDGLTVSRSARCAAASLAQYFDADDGLRGDQAGPGLLPRALRLPVPFGQVRPGRSCPSTTSARWRTRAWSPSREAYVFRGAGHRRRSTRAGPTRSCTRWPTCGSATWSPWCGGTTCGSRSPSPTSWAPSPARRPPGGPTRGSRSPTAARPGRTARTSCPRRTRSSPTSVDLEEAKLNFDGITYAKGARVLKQLVAYVGRDAFLEGARRYFRAHAFGNTTLDDLLAELAATSGRDLARVGAGLAADQWRLHVDARAPRQAARDRPDQPAAAHPRRRALRLRRRRLAGADRAPGGGHLRCAHPGRADRDAPGAAQRRRPHLRQGPARAGSRSAPSRPRSTASSTRWPAGWSGRRCGTPPATACSPPSAT